MQTESGILLLYWFTEGFDKQRNKILEDLKMRHHILALFLQTVISRQFDCTI